MSGIAPNAIPISDDSVAELADEVQQAREALLRTLRRDPQAEWSPQQLIDAAKGSLANTVVSIALWNMVDSGELEVDSYVHVRLAEASGAVAHA